MAASTSVAVCVVTAAGRCHASMQWRCRAARGCPQAPAVASHVGTRSDAVPLRTALPCDRAAFCRTAFTAPARPGYVVSVCMSVCLVCLSCLSVRLSVCLYVWAVPSTPVRGCMPVEPRLYRDDYCTCTAASPIRPAWCLRPAAGPRIRSRPRRHLTNGSASVRLR